MFACFRAPAQRPQPLNPRRCTSAKSRWPAQARPSRVRSSEAARLVERLDLDDRGTVVAADPEHGPRPGLYDEDAPDVGRARQEILGDLAGLYVETRNQVV